MYHETTRNMWRRSCEIETKEAEEVLDRRREVREWQSSYGGRTRFSYLCGRWVGAASDIEEKQRQKRMYVLYMMRGMYRPSTQRGTA